MSGLSNPSAKTLYGLGALAIGAAVGGTAYYRREDFLNGWKYGYEHMTFVKNLWDEQGLKARLEGLEALGTERDVLFFKYVEGAQSSLPFPVFSWRHPLMAVTTPTSRRARLRTSSHGHFAFSLP